MSKAPMRVAVTGAAGQIGYSLLFRIASGEMLGKDQPVILQLLDLPQAQQAVKGVMMELDDCAFPLLAGMVATDDPNVAFKDADVCLLVGARPRSQGHGACRPADRQRRHLHRSGQGHCRERQAKTSRFWSSATRATPTPTSPLPPPRRLAAPTRTTTTACCAWTTTAPCRNWPTRPAAPFRPSRSWSSGATTRPRCTPTTATATSNGDNVKALINDHAWNNDVFLPTVGKRGAAIIEARGLSSAASAANAAIDHIRDWVLGSNDMGHHGRSVRRFLRHPGWHRLRLPVRMQGRLLQDHPGSGNRRLQPAKRSTSPSRS